MCVRLRAEYSKELDEQLNKGETMNNPEIIKVDFHDNECIALTNEYGDRIIVDNEFMQLLRDRLPNIKDIYNFLTGMF